MSKDYMNVGLPMKLVDKIDSIVKEGLYTSRSEFVKDAVRRLLLFYETLDEKKKKRSETIEEPLKV